MRRSFTASCWRMVSMRILVRRDQFLDKLVKADRGIDHHRLHVGEVLQVRIQVHGIEDAEPFLVDIGAQPRGPADHLLIKDAAVDPSQEHEIGDGGHINARSEKIDRDGNVGIGVVLERENEFPDPINAAGDLLDCRVVNLPVSWRTPSLFRSPRYRHGHRWQRRSAFSRHRVRTGRCGWQVPRQPRD